MTTKSSKKQGFGPQSGIIVPDPGPFVPPMPKVMGAIRDKWLALGGAGGGLGQPLTDELRAPDGIGRFNHFQGGSIYWTSTAGAHEVHGAIRERWVSLGAERSFLGYPISDETGFSEGGQISVFQNGSIYWWPDTGAIELRGVIVHYTGLVCFGETGEFSSADEPYVVLGIIDPQGASASRSQVYEGVDAGESRPDLLEIYRGKPNGITLTTLLMEHDEGDPDKYRDLVKVAVDGGFTAVKSVLPLIPVVGSILGLVVPPIMDTIEPTVTTALNNLIGAGDDRIGETTIYLSPKQMVVLAARTTNSVERGVGFKVATPLLSGDGASYKVFFGIVPA